ncbi:hypothetical protein HYH03_001168 [Edaphochlamys debaryana]|uniref:Helicase ATP-binding domain-containing protein n=1 Tax=Edaphochlamys debaryana TaxID=47281 RepID=A0A835YMU4_9CHLO|nr:hypothetical protein HYH03_001168 [Edaphochlamys debaryana]|eukprot:KAG2501380.1 hypothetical protein HYH03_001168 [Edaphochlamys debaryana]
MGQGKTLSAIAVAHVLLGQGMRQGTGQGGSGAEAEAEAGAGPSSDGASRTGGLGGRLRVLVLAPANSVCDTKAEFEKWLLLLSAEDVKLSRLRKEKLRRMLLEGPGLVVVDEAHMLRNPKTGLYRAVMKFKTRLRLALTGTPLQNNLREFRSLLNWVQPEVMKEYTVWNGTDAVRGVRA